MDNKTLIAVAILLTFHYVADFILQTDMQAKMKSSDNRFLGVHCFVYAMTVTLGFIMLKISGMLPQDYNIPAVSSVLIASHFTIDYVTSRINKKLYISGRHHEFFVVVGLDQLLHSLILLILLVSF